MKTAPQWISSVKFTPDDDATVRVEEKETIDTTNHTYNGNRIASQLPELRATTLSVIDIETLSQDGISAQVIDKNRE